MSMDNKQIYKRTIGFSLRRLLWNVIGVVIAVVLAAVGFVIAESTTNKGLIGLGLGLIVGAIIAGILLHFFAYTFKAGQIAMMTRAITEGKLPTDVVGEGKKVVKERFATVAAYYAVTGVIKGIFQQIGNAITAIGEAVGGNTGGTVGSTISAAIQTVVAYLCDCCLGWVFYRKNEKATKATCEGAVIFFRHGKTLAKNLGRVFGMGLLSFILIGGVFTGIFYLISLGFPGVFANLSVEIVEAAARAGKDLPEFVHNATSLALICSAIGGVIMWSMIHSVFVRPFVLVGVLRNFINSGIDDIPTESSFDELDKKSPKFKKLHSEL